LAPREPQTAVPLGVCVDVVVVVVAVAVEVVAAAVEVVAVVLVDVAVVVVDVEEDCVACDELVDAAGAGCWAGLGLAAADAAAARTARSGRPAPIAWSGIGTALMASTATAGAEWR
jgi:hypothetical protein